VSEVKFFSVEGRMLISHDRMPTWQKFRKIVRAVKPEHAIERVLSELGSNHRVKRYHIVIERVAEVKLEEIKDVNLIRLAKIKRWVKV